MVRKAEDFREGRRSAWQETQSRMHGKPVVPRAIARRGAEGATDYYVAEAGPPVAALFIVRWKRR
jgi:hypothetical protein